MCLSSVSSYRPHKPTPVPMKSTFRYNYVQFHSGVIFSFLLFLGLGSVIGFRVWVRDR